MVDCTVYVTNLIMPMHMYVRIYVHIMCMYLFTCAFLHSNFKSYVHTLYLSEVIRHENIFTTICIRTCSAVIQHTSYIETNWLTVCLRHFNHTLYK